MISTFSLVYFILLNYFYLASCNDVSGCKLGSCSSKQYSDLILSRAEATHDIQNFRYDPVSNVGESFEFNQLFEKFMQNEL